MYLSRNATGARTTVSYWAVASLAAGAAAVVWWVTGVNAYHGPDHMIGPYRVPLTIEYIVGTIAVAGGLLGLRAAIRSTRAARAVTWPTTLVLVLTAMMTAGLWRVMTAGGNGANIGGGMAAFAGPILVAASLFVAVCGQRSSGGMRIRTFLALSVLTLGTGPILFAAVRDGLAP